jgi:two-component system chemotaxis sensor kinase CheA
MMVDREKLAQRLMATYLEELQEHVVSLNRNLMAMEDDPAAEERPELFNLLFRAAHSLKGASRAVSIELVETVCHHMEDVLGAARDGKLELMPQHFSVLFQAVDGIEDVGKRLRASQDLTDSPLHAVLPGLTSAAAGELEPASGTESTAATAEPTVTEHVAVEEATSQPTQVSRPAVAENVSLPREVASELAATSPKKPAAATGSARPKPKKKAGAKPVKKSTRKPRKGAVDKGSAKVDRQPAALAEVATSPVSSAPTAAPALPSRSPAPASVRVAAEKLDSLLAQSGELLVARRRVQSRVDDIDELRQMVTECQNEWRAAVTPLQGMANQGKQASGEDVRRLLETLNLNRESLTRLERGLERVGTQLSRDGGLLNQVCTALEDEVHRVRMLPFAEACGGLDRVVRDVARETGKQVKLVIGGKDVELDRAVLEGLKDPLMHLVRNGVDHGIETPQERTAAGKPATAKLTVSASLHGAQVEIVVEDDGKGFDIERIREKARSQGLPDPDDDAKLARLVFRPGFSTASEVTQISGRGVGLDVVQSQIEAMQGSVDLSFSAGRGSRFILRLPLTLTTTRAIMVRAGHQTYAIPTVNVLQIVRISPDEIRTVGQRKVLPLGGSPIPIARLTDTLGMDTADKASDEAKILVVVMGSGQSSTATIVDELLTEQEITIKHLGRRIRHVRHISGGTLLPSGETALVLNVANVMRTQFNLETIAPRVVRETKPQHDAPRRLLVVDDSVTTRALMQAILESAGFSVQTAADGRFALEKLDRTNFDLVVSDVDMPRLNGFGLTEAIRKSDHLSRLPVILVSARGSDEDKARGIQAGADGYIVKADFASNNLVETILQLL